MKRKIEHDHIVVNTRDSDAKESVVQKTANNKRIDTESREYREGIAARIAGFSGWSNPYDKRTSAGVNWQHGWRKAHHEGVSVDDLARTLPKRNQKARTEVRRVKGKRR